MPQIQINGELREVSQAEYDALTQNGTASTPAPGSYEEYAAIRAKEEAVKQLAAGDEAVGETTNVSPEFQQELSNLKTTADTSAGSNASQYEQRYAQEQQDLYTNAPLSREALQEDLSAPPPITAPGTVGVAVPEQQGTNGQVVGTLNTAVPGLSEPTGSIVSSPVRGLTDGGLTTGTPAAGIESAPTYPTEDPQVPVPSTEGAGTFVPPAPPPDAAFRAEQAQQENRWIQAAATNPESIRDDGSVVVDLGDGRIETINRDGSYSISGGDGTFRFDAAGQQTSYTSPTINGLSVTTTTDGIQYTNYTAGPLTVSEITKDGQPISTTVSTQIADVRLTQTQVTGGEVVSSASTIIPSDDPNVAGTLVTTAQVGEGDIVTTETALLTKQQTAEAAAAANAETIKLREDLIAAQQQVESGTPLSDTQVAALGEQAAATEAAYENLAAAEQALAEQDPTVVSATEDPEVPLTAVQDPLPALDTTQFSPDDRVTAADPEVTAAQQTQSLEPPALADLATRPNDEATLADPEVTAAGQEPSVLVYPEPETPTQDPILLAQAPSTTVSDVVLGPGQVVVPISELGGFAIDSEGRPVVLGPGDTEVGLIVDPNAVDVQGGGIVVTAPADLLDDDILSEDGDGTTSGTGITEPVDGISPYGEEDEQSVRNLEDPAVVDSNLDPEVPQPITPEDQGEFSGEPAAVGGNFTTAYNPETGTYDVVDLDTGAVVDSGLSQQDATLAAQEFSLGDPQFPNEIPPGDPSDADLLREPADIDVTEVAFSDQDSDLFVQQDEIESDIDQQQFEDDPGADEFGPFYEEPENIDLDQIEYQDTEGADEFPQSDIVTGPDSVTDTGGVATDTLDGLTSNDPGFVPGSDIQFGPDSVTDTGGVPTETLDGLTSNDPGFVPADVLEQQQAEAAAIQAATQLAREQAEFQQQRKEANDGDWRVRLRLAPGARYLYRDPDGPGILDPLLKTDGVVFPYTPQITTAYKADYESYNLTHANYRGFFYKGSYVDDIQINAVFTAQDSVEANYLLAVIHFFRSATKMFYGKDPQAGAPPPIVYLQGLGVYQFNLHPCVIGQFNYNLPTDVDYIRAQSPNINGTNLLQRRSRQSAPTNPFSSAVSRIENLLKPQGIRTGAQQFPPPAPTLGQNQPTYVPTKMEISLILHPIQSRSEVSRQFSVKNFANGNLLKGGFW